MFDCCPALFTCEPFTDTRQVANDDYGYFGYDFGFGYEDDDTDRKQSVGTICAIEACAGTRLVANVCEEYTGDTFFRLFDSDWQLVAENDNALGALDSYDDDENDNTAYGYSSYYGEGYHYLSPQKREVACSKIAYTVPVDTGMNNASGRLSEAASSCRIYYLQQSCRGEVSCSGTTQVAGGIAAPTSMPTTFPTAAPSGAADWKQSMYVFSFRTSVLIRFECDGSRCPGLVEMDGPSQEAFREVFASTMLNISLNDVSIVSVSMYYSYYPIFRGLFSTQVITDDSSRIPEIIANLTSEIQEAFAPAKEGEEVAPSAILASMFVRRTVELGSVTVNGSSTTVDFSPPEVSPEHMMEEVQSFVPSTSPSIRPSYLPSSKPSGEPSGAPSRGKLAYLYSYVISLNQK